MFANKRYILDKSTYALSPCKISLCSVWICLVLFLQTLPDRQFCGVQYFSNKIFGNAFGRIGCRYRRKFSWYAMLPSLFSSLTFQLDSHPSFQKPASLRNQVLCFASELTHLIIVSSLSTYGMFHYEANDSLREYSLFWGKDKNWLKTAFLISVVLNLRLKCFPKNANM